MILQEVGTSLFSRKTYDEYQEEDKAGMLVAMEYNREPTNIAVSVGNGQLHQISMEPIARPLDCMHDQQAVLTDGKPPRKYIVRRLTPLECCRLQGFPDWWTDGADGSDSAVYKMWGNGIALPCATDVIGRLAKELDNHKKKRMYLEVSFYENDGEQKEDNGQENQSQVVPDQD